MWMKCPGGGATNQTIQIPLRLIIVSSAPGFYVRTASGPES